MSRKLK